MMLLSDQPVARTGFVSTPADRRIAPAEKADS
jgi:hypothetical protein